MSHKGSTAPLIAIIVLLFLGFLLHIFSGWGRSVPSTADAPSSLPPASFSDISDWQTYVSGNLGFSIQHPKDFVADENYSYVLALPTDPSQNPIPGVAFVIPSRYERNTNLASDSRISVEQSPDFCQLSKMQSYSGAAGDVPPGTEEIGGLLYKQVVRSDAGAGNFYYETLYSTGQPATNGKCYGIRLFIHSINLGVLQESDPDVREYDEAGLTRIFKDMIRTISFAR